MSTMVLHEDRGLDEKQVQKAALACPVWPLKQRLHAFQTWQTLPVPSVRDEAWKYTSLARFEKLALNPNKASTHRGPFKGFPFEIKSPAFYFINGRFAADLSSPLSDEIRILSQTLAPENVDLAQNSGYFESLNSALFSDGAVLELQKNRNEEDPIYLVFLHDADENLAMQHLRHHIRVKTNVHSACVLMDWNLNDIADFSTQIIDIDLEEKAELNCLHLRKPHRSGYHYTKTSAQLAAESKLIHFNLDFGAKLVRNELTVSLLGEKARCELNGLALALGHDHIDNHTQIRHLAAETHSQEHYRGIINDKAVNIFHGHILVAATAPQSNAEQHNKNILLSAQAEAYAQPQLEIYNKEVQCTHGATIGDLDEEALFYLRSRGLSDLISRQLLILGFAHNLLATIQNIPLQHVLETLIKAELALTFDFDTE